MLGESDEFRKLHRAIEKAHGDIYDTIEATCGICLEGAGFTHYTLDDLAYVRQPDHPLQWWIDVEDFR